MNTFPLHHQSATSRRDFLVRTGGGFGAVALAGMMGSERREACAVRPFGGCLILAGEQRT